MSEKYLTLATWGLVLCTFLLVVATFVLWSDSVQKGKEQRERWNRDELREAQARRPQFQFGLKRRQIKSFALSFDRGVSDSAAYLWVVNLGLSGLYVEKLFVKHRDFGEGVIEVNEIARPGDQLNFDIPDSFWQQVPGVRGSSDGNYLYGDHEIWLELADSEGAFFSPRIIHQFLFMQRSFHELKRGSQEDRQPTCPKCGLRLNAVLPATGLLTETEVQKEFWRPVMAELRKSCPNHSSKHLKSLGDNIPAWIPENIDGGTDA